jgi:YesN/AraC family two-component response regulator
MALEMFKKGEYDLVLMDMQMPVMDGYTATAEIRKFEKARGAEDTPIIALSAYALGEEIQKSLDAGCNEHLTKPIKKAKLMETIGRYAMSIGEKKAREEDEEDMNMDLDTESEAEFIVYVDEDFEDLIPEFFEDIPQ